MAVQYRRAAPAWPLRFAAAASEQLHYDERLTAQAIEAVLATAIGERVVRRDFGSRLPLLVFTSVEEAQALAEVYVREAVERWLPYVQVLTVDVQPAPGGVQITLDYIERPTASRSQATVTLALPEGVGHAS